MNDQTNSTFVAEGIIEIQCVLFCNFIVCTSITLRLKIPNALNIVSHAANRMEND